MSVSEHNRRWKEAARVTTEKREQSRNIPSRFSGGGADYYQVLIDKGNTLETTQLGIKYYDGELVDIPSAYDPDVTTVYPDGMGRGTLFKNGVAQPGYVLVVNDNRGLFRNALLQGDKPWASPARVTVSGGGSVLAYTVS